MAIATIKMDLGSSRRAKETLEALRPETRSTPNLRSQITLKAKGKVIIFVFGASGVSTLRASINSFCRWAGLVNKTFDVLDEYYARNK